MTQILQTLRPIKTVRLFAFFALISGLFLLAAQSAFAGEITAFDKGQFDQAIEAGNRVVLDFNASWCTTCKRQGVALKSLASGEEFKNVRFFTVDYDSAKDLKIKYRVVRQSTIIVLEGSKEVARVIGESRPDRLKKLILTEI